MILIKKNNDETDVPYGSSKPCFYDFYNDVFYYKWYWHNLKDFVYSSFALRTAGALQLA